MNKDSSAIGTDADRICSPMTLLYEPILIPFEVQSSSLRGLLQVLVSHTPVKHRRLHMPSLTTAYTHRLICS
jgi:hypothetical protein